MAAAQPTSSRKGAIRQWVLVIVAGSVILGLVGRQLFVLAQTESTAMPDGWQSMTAAQFLAAAHSLLNNPTKPAAEHEREVVAHAWDQFLNQGPFLHSGNWQTVEQAIKLFAARRDQLVAGETPEARTASAKAIEAQLATLRTRLVTRLTDDGSILEGRNYSQVWGTLESVRQVGGRQPEQMQVLARWMDTNDWQALASFSQRTQLLENLAGDHVRADQRISARWTGFLKPPTSGQYILEQLRQYRGDPAVKIWIDGQPVLDTTPPAEGQPDTAARFRSQPVQLSAADPAVIRVDMRMDFDGLSRIMKTADVRPGVVLLWESAQVPKGVIPASAYLPPSGFATTGSKGLKGEYFKNDQWTTEARAAVRLDAALDRIFNTGPVAPTHPEQQQLLLDHCVAKTLDGVFLDSLEGFALSVFVHQDLQRVVERMRLSQQRELALELAQHPQILAAMSEFGMGTLLRSLYVLPGKEHLDLLEAWTAQHPQPRTEAGNMTLKGEWGSYMMTNFDRFWLLSRFFEGPYAGDIDLLLQEHLTNPDESCNLTIAYALAFAARDTNRARLYRRTIDQALANEELTGEQRMTWLLAKAYAAEVLIGGKPRIGMGMDALEEALLTAPNGDKKFWALGEVVSRWVSLGRVETVEALLDKYQSKFQAPAQQDQMDNWRKQVTELASRYAQLTAQQEVGDRRASNMAYVSELRRRLDKAREREDDYTAGRLGQLIEAAEAAQE